MLLQNKKAVFVMQASELTAAEAITEKNYKKDYALYKKNLRLQEKAIQSQAPISLPTKTLPTKIFQDNKMSEAM